MELKFPEMKKISIIFHFGVVSISLISLFGLIFLDVITTTHLKVLSLNSFFEHPQMNAFTLMIRVMTLHSLNIFIHFIID